MATRDRTRRSAIVAAALLFVVGCTSATTPLGTEPAPSALPTSSSTVVHGDSEAIVEAARGVVAEPSSSRAGQFVDAVAASGDERWVPWLVDLLRLDVSLQVSNTIRSTLESITGVASESRIPDLIAYGSWATNNGLDGGDGYREFKVGLYERIDTAFGPLLDSVQDPRELAAIQWGGVPVGGIPELNDPPRVPAAVADWMFDDEIILGVVANGEAVAYPLRILARHELANDTVGGDPLAVVYCTLCRSALVFERTIDGQIVQFLTSGLLANSNKIMLDVETQTLWSHLRGTGIGGTHLGTKLELRSVNHMRWSDWVAENPDTLVLEIPEPTFFDDPERPPIAYDYSPGAAYASYYDNPDVWFPVLDTPDVWPLKTEVIGLVNDGDSVALSVDELNATDQEITIEVGGESFRIEPTGVGARVYDATGERVIIEQSFWFAWFGNHPDTRTLTDL